MTKLQKQLLKWQVERVVIGADITETTIEFDGDTPIMKKTRKPLVEAIFHHNLD